MKMMFKRRYFLLLAALFFCFGALLFFFVHEGRLLLPEEEPAARYNIQVIFKALANPPDFWRVVEQGVQSAAAEYGVNCEVTAPPMEKDVDRQIELVREAIAKHPDAIILAASDYEQMVPVCKEVTDAGILLVTVDSDVNYDGRRCFVGTDNVAMGRKLAELVDEAVPSEQKIGVMGHVEGARTAVERRDGLIENVAGGADRVAALDYCDGSEIVSRQRTKEMLIAHPEIRCMVGLNESSALGVANAIRDLGLEGEVGLGKADPVHGAGDDPGVRHPEPLQHGVPERLQHGFDPPGQDGARGGQHRQRDHQEGGPLQKGEPEADVPVHERGINQEEKGVMR